MSKISLIFRFFLLYLDTYSDVHISLCIFLLHALQIEEISKIYAYKINLYQIQYKSASTIKNIH